MIFRKKVTRNCTYCLNGTCINDEEILCKKRGVVPKDNKCLKFRYDPYKRYPLKAKATDFSKYDNEDFNL